MIAAAKEKMLSGFGPWCADLPLAAGVELSENSRQGFERKNAALHLGQEVCNSTTALGIERGLLGSCIGSRIQTWNRYGYVANNPLLFRDPLGLDDAACDPTDDSCDYGGGGGGGGSGGGPSGPIQVPGTTIDVTATPDPVDGTITDLTGLLLGVDPLSSNPLANGGVTSRTANNGTPQQQQCLTTVQGAVNTDLGTQSNYLGVTKGMDASGMRGGAYNFNFFAPGVTFGSPGFNSVPGVTCGRFSDGLHVPVPYGPCNLSGDPTISPWGAGFYNGVQGSFLTAHIDSSNPFQDLYSFFAHLINNVILQKKHGC